MVDARLFYLKSCYCGYFAACLTFVVKLFCSHVVLFHLCKGPSTLATLFSHRWPRFCGGDIYSRRKPLFSSFGEHTAVGGSSVRQAVARPRHRQSVCIHNIHVALVCSGPPQKRGHLWLNKVASVLGP